MEKEYFKKMRLKVGCSAKMFAKLLGSNVCSIYNYEAGRAKPRTESLIKRIDALLELLERIRKDPDYLVKLFNIK
jgi:DNA-binding transcriptional regulator YiaG